jgi:hypothetical protein
MVGDKDFIRAGIGGSEAQSELEASVWLEGKPVSVMLVVGGQRLYAQAYAELCEAVTGKAPSPAPPPEEEFKEQVRAFFKKHHDSLHKRICVDLKYCENSKKLETLPKALQGLILLATILTDFAVLAGTVSASWLVLSGLLDELCQCEKA